MHNDDFVIPNCYKGYGFVSHLRLTCPSPIQCISNLMRNFILLMFQITSSETFSKTIENIVVIEQDMESFCSPSLHVTIIGKSQISSWCKNPCVSINLVTSLIMTVNNNVHKSFDSTILTRHQVRSARATISMVDFHSSSVCAELKQGPNIQLHGTDNIKFYDWKDNFQILQQNQKRNAKLRIPLCTMWTWGVYSLEHNS